jgi:DNA-binding transcriptional LysR family regulator
MLRAEMLIALNNATEPLIQAGLPSLAQFLKSGELVEILPELRPEPLPVSVVVAHRHNLSRRVRFFIDWLEQTLQPYLDR